MGQGTTPSTDAQPFICLHGEEKDSGNIPLTIEGGEGFLPGAVDDFTISCPRLGDIKSITIGHDNRGQDAQTSKWKVDQVLVTCMHTQRGRRLAHELVGRQRGRGDGPGGQRRG